MPSGFLQEPGMFRREEDSLFGVWYNVPALVGLLIHLIKVVTVVAVVTDGLTLSTLEYHGSSLVHAIMLARVKSPGGWAESMLMNRGRWWSCRLVETSFIVSCYRYLHVSCGGATSHISNDDCASKLTAVKKMGATSWLLCCPKRTDKVD